MYAIKIIHQAQRDLDQIPAKILSKISADILKLKENPRLHSSIKLTQTEGYRIRIGDYRVLYRIDDKAKEVYIYRIKHRREVYR